MVCKLDDSGHFQAQISLSKESISNKSPGTGFWGRGNWVWGKNYLAQQNLEFKDIFSLGTRNTKPVFWESLKAGISCALLNAEGLTREQKVLISSSKEPASSSLPSALTLGPATWRSYKKGGIIKKDISFALDSNVDISGFFLEKSLLKMQCNYRAA